MSCVHMLLCTLSPVCIWGRLTHPLTFRGPLKTNPHIYPVGQLSLQASGKINFPVHPMANLRLNVVKMVYLWVRDCTATCVTSSSICPWCKIEPRYVLRVRTLAAIGTLPNLTLLILIINNSSSSPQDLSGSRADEVLTVVVGALFSRVFPPPAVFQQGARLPSGWCGCSLSPDPFTFPHWPRPEWWVLVTAAVTQITFSGVVVGDSQ